MSSIKQWFHGRVTSPAQKVQPSSVEPLKFGSIPTYPPRHGLDGRIDQLIADADVSWAKQAAAAAVTESENANARAAAESQNAFALALQAILGRQQGNLVYSPLSIHMALAMTHAGARGSTASEMRAALRVECSDESLNGELVAIRRLRSSTGAACELVIANSLWAQVGAPLLPSYVDTVTQRFGATVSAVDFHNDSSESARTINDWVSTHTRHRIPHLLDPTLLTPETCLILANAVYFKGTWEHPFEPECTHDAPFYLEDGAAVAVPLMHETMQVGYRKGEGHQAVRLPYRDTTLAMVVVLPDRREGLEDLENSLTQPMIDEVVRSSERSAELFLPRFKITWGGGLPKALRELGIDRVFTPKADLSGINGRKPPDEGALCVSDAIHRAFCEVNEAGTEAVAATAFATIATGLMDWRPRVPVFRADHPFLFAIVDTRSGAILFLGRVADPRLET